MMKISALNEETNEESEEENTATVTKEAQEQLVLTEYNKALELFKEDKTNDALSIFKDLLETELLDQVEKPTVRDGRTRPMLSLKYCCYKNIGAIYKKLGDFNAAIDNYWEAANLDDTDVMLWHTMGQLTMQTCNLEFACTAFKQALICNPNHWPSLDNIITVMYAIPDYMNCLLYISIALERDPMYIKGLMFREKIFKDIPYFQESYKLFNSDWALDPPIPTDFDRAIGNKLLVEAQVLSEKWIEFCKPDFEYKPTSCVRITESLKKLTWLELGECLVDTYEHIVQNNLNFTSKISFEIEKPISSKSNQSTSLSEEQQKIDNEVVDDARNKEDRQMILDSPGADSIMNITSGNSTKMEDNNINHQADTGSYLIDHEISDDKLQQMDIDIIDEDDDKSSSSGVHIIEDEDDPLKLESSEIEEAVQIAHKLNNGHSDSSNKNQNTSGSSSSDSSVISNNGNNNRLLDNDVEMIKVPSSDCNVFTSDIVNIKFDKNSEQCEKSKADIINDNNNDDNDKLNSSNDKSKDDIDSNPNNKSNEDTIAVATSTPTSKLTDDPVKPKDEQQKVKKRRRSSLCFLQQWAWSSMNSMRRSARARGSRRENEREDVQLEAVMRRLFPSNLLPDTIKIIKDDPIKNMDDSMDTMDLYQLFANQDNNVNDNNSNNNSNNININTNINSDDDEEAATGEVNDVENRMNFSNSKIWGSESTRDFYNYQKNQYFGTEIEKKQVLAFINQHTGISNIMIIIGKLTELLSTKWNHSWPNKLSDIYQRLYLFTRQHIPHNNSLLWRVDDTNKDNEDTILMYDAEMTLLFSELYTDKWLDNKPNVLPRSTIDKFGIGLPTEELGYIIFSNVLINNSDDLLNNIDNLFYLLRVLWVKVNIFLCQGDTNVAIKTLQFIADIIEDCEHKLSHEISIRLPNCKYNSRITLSTVKKRLTSIERGEKLGQVEKLYEEKKYYELSVILKDTFKFGKSAKNQNSNTRTTPLFINNLKLINIDRIKQFSLLLESLWQLQQYEDCYSWSEMCLNEAWQYYINDTSEEGEEQKKWSSSILNCLEKLESCVDMAGTSVSRYLPDTRVSRLIQILIQIICHQLDVSDNAVEMPLETVTPWILLHHVLQYQDDKERATRSRNVQKYKKRKRKMKKPSSRSVSNHGDDDEDIERETKEIGGYNTDSSSNTIESNTDKENIPSPIMLLFIGHDFLGRHSWCCINEAKLLLFTIKTVVTSMYSPRYTCIREKITKHLEQIFWCLYGHPNRANKTKPKHLEDHGVPQITLTWEIAQLLFEFYKPDVLPEFDTPRPMSITSDIKILFKKINSLVPPDQDPSGMVDQVTAYIVGDTNKIPCVKKPLPYQVDSLYYLLGDYSFKNNNWLSATKYYTMDICLHPNAFNSWVALAMSVSTLLGTALNNCKPLTDITKLLFQAKLAQRSYQRAVELKPGHSVIWIEYGNFVYTVHSFCSRLLKQESDTLSMEKFAILETRKEDTLEIAANCFVSANRIYLANIDDAPQMQDERWLFHYMLAKIAEKHNNDPPVYLEHYATASELLHKNNAHYPKKISHKNAHYLSIEALEVHYRVHACILKYFEQHEGKPLKKSLGMVFYKHLLDCANGPFMQFQSKLSKNKCYRDEIVPETTTVVTRTTTKNTITTKSTEKCLSTENKSDNDIYDYANNVTTIVTDTDTDTDLPKKLSLENKTQQANNDNDIIILTSGCDNKNNDINDCKNDNSVSSSKKRTRTEDQLENDSIKRIKIGSVSHLQMMQDVVGFIDDLITNVCDIVASQQQSTEKQSDNEEILIISSDEGGDNDRNNEQYLQTNNTSHTGMLYRKDSQLLAGHETEMSIENYRKTSNNQESSINEEMLMSKQCIKCDNEQMDKYQMRENSPAYMISTKDKNVKDSKLIVDKKKTQVSTVKDEATMSRRGSQESTTTTLTTTTTETNNSSFSSSDESSSSDDSSDSDSSTGDSDSESIESDSDKKKTNQADEEEEEEYFTESEVSKLISHCIAGLEQCVLRFPEHYKSIYRLCHFFFNYKSVKDNAKCRDLLLGTYKCQFYTGMTFQGLFADRKHSNFFNGVWRIPNDEIDRPGSFASHMSRCVTLLMQVLKETEDSRMLMELCIQLRKIPDPDKKYVRDSEREQLSRQAFTLCLQSLRARVQTMGSPTPEDSTSLVRTDSRTRVLLDVYKIYQQVQKNFQGKEVQAFATLLVDTYKVYMDIKSSEGNLLDTAVRCCQQQNLANKIATQSQSNYNHHMQPNSSSNLSVTIATASNNASIPPVITSNTVTNVNTLGSNSISITTTTAISTNSINSSVTQGQPIITSPQSAYQRKTTYKPTGTGRPRGRPPNMNKYMQNLQVGNATNMMNQYGTAKRNFSNYLGASGSQPLLNPYFMNPLMDQNMIQTMLTTGLAGNMLDSLTTANYLKNINNYQDLLRHYQNITSINSLNSSFNNSSMGMSSNANMTTGISNVGNTAVQQLLNLNVSMAAAACSTSIVSTTNTTTINANPSTNVSTITSTSTTITSITTAMPTLTTTTTVTTTTPTTSTNITDCPKEIPHHLSITPVVQHKPHKSQKHGTSSSSSVECTTGNIGKNIHQSKSIPQHSMAQVSLLKSSVLQQNKVIPPKHSSSPSSATSATSTSPSSTGLTGQIRVAKNLTEPQLAHNLSSLPVSPLKSSSPSSIIAGISPSLTVGLQNSGLNIKPVPTSMTRLPGSGTSLQHKLQLKKQAQPFQQSTSRKQKSGNSKFSSNPLSMGSNYQSNVSSINTSGSMINPAFISNDLAGISVSAVSSSPEKISLIQHQPNIKKTSSKYKSTSSIEISEAMQSCLPSHTSVSVSSTAAETLNMLSQLQQHSHLEIIPQSKNHNVKVSSEYSKNLPLSLSVASQKSIPSKSVDSVRANNSDRMPCVYDIPARGKSTLPTSSPKKPDKNPSKDSVEIITLDD